jgi:hypothetical protein
MLVVVAMGIFLADALDLAIDAGQMYAQRQMAQTAADDRDQDISAHVSWRCQLGCVNPVQVLSVLENRASENMNPPPIGVRCKPKGSWFEYRLVSQNKPSTFNACPA